MTIRFSICLMICATVAAAASQDSSISETSALCSEAWQRFVDESVLAGDGQGHGPDLGSDEWKSVVEFKLGIRGKSGVPPRDTPDWCRHVDELVRDRGAMSVAGNTAALPPREAGPSFSCDEVPAGSVEAMVCEDEELASLDRKLAGVYAAASAKATNEHPPQLRAEQRGWIKGRDECWKSEDKRGCVRDEYRRRTAALQAMYRLVPMTGPAFFVCDGNPANVVIATFFETDPATLTAEYGDSVSLMYQQPAASGTRYQGRNESFSEHQGEALISWGRDAPQMRCQRSHESQ